VFADPVVRVLTGVLVVVVLLFLTTIVAALFLGVLGSETPRTTRERDLVVGQYEVDAGNTDPMVWKQYIAALVDSGRIQEAQQVVDRGMQVIDNRPGADMTFAQTQVYYSDGKYEDAIATATEGMDALTAYHEAQKNTDDTPESKGQPISDNYWGMLYLRAVSHRELGQLEQALEDFDVYLAEKKAASNVLLERGDLRLELGDREGAEADYRQALVHIPDYQPAIDALEKLGVER
jgi:tetratricopeptide (TPR) repeat protein